MRQYLTPKLLPYLSYTAGILTAGALALLYIAGEDDRGLFPAMHLSWIAACLVAAAAVALLVYICQPLEGKFRYRQLFHPSTAAAAGNLAAALGFAASGITDILSSGDAYGTVCGVFCLVSGALLLFLAHCSRAGQRPVYWIRAIITVCLMVRLICCFRHWTDPQLETYLFPLLASVFLMLASYHRTALDAGSGSRKAYVFTSQAAVVLCCGAVLSDSWLFYLTAAIWMGLDIPDLRLAKKSSQKD